MIDSILLTLCLPHQDKNDINEEIEEMKLLANTINFNIVDSVKQNRNSIDPATYFGKGKIKAIFEKASLLKIKTIFINDDLRPNHYKNIKKIAEDNIEIIDRTCLILNIFSNNAKTNESKSQVRLAYLQYMMPRLTGMWTHLERQMGGIGTRGGPGEKQIEIDRRIVRNDIKKLKNNLSKVTKQRDNQKKLRKDIFKISLVGYTNAGKSSLLKKISGYDAFIKDQLFATLETTTKRVTLPSKSEVIISDTVGFLRKLPHNLVASFRSTLSEIKDSDLIIKVVDLSSSDIIGHIRTINETLEYLKADKCQSIYVFNKIDLVENKNIFSKINKKYNKPLMISTLKDLRIDTLINTIDDIVTMQNKEYKIFIDYKSLKNIDYIYKNSIVVERKDKYEVVELKISCNEKSYNKIIKKIGWEKYSQEIFSRAL